jgi:hypothetical protein
MDTFGENPRGLHAVMLLRGFLAEVARSVALESVVRPGLAPMRRRTLSGRRVDEALHLTAGHIA